MAIDFGKLSTGSNVDTIISPRELFSALPGKNAAKFQYPRDVQSQVWEGWFERREESDLILKMNTGSGKTVVGLLILKSCLNEKKTPAVYIVPDNYLVNQVRDEAKDLGIDTTDDVSSPRFLSGKAILVTNIHKLANGMSKFGVGDEGIKISIGSLLIDDAHACNETIEEKFTINISSDSDCYEELYELFKAPLHEQCESKAIEIESGDYTSYMPVPFWVWKNKISEISKILVDHRTTDELRFTLPLLKESLPLCRCVVSAASIEITPYCVPIHMIPSIIHCQRKVFMTATLVDDSILASHFGVREQSLCKPIVPDTAGDIGDRMILLPQVINTDLSDTDIKLFCKQASKHINVVVIVPSEYRAKFWSDQADRILNKTNLYQGIEELRNKKVGLVILVNRYDGIDLPGDACRFLVIDNLPDVRRLIDRVNQSVLMGSRAIRAQIVQRIEQGMGRAVRSSDDYCAVFLMGKNLTNQLYAGEGLENFSPGTKAQLHLSEQLSEQIEDKTLLGIWKDVILHCLSRDQGWVAASKSALASLTYDRSSNVDAGVIAQRKAFDAASHNNYLEAAKILEQVANDTTDEIGKSYLKYCLSEYINLYDESEAQKVLMSAAASNRRLMKPIQGISYHKLESSTLDQAKACFDFLQGRHQDPNINLIEVNGILDSLIFKPNTAPVFEENTALLAKFIGFQSQRPEEEYSKGPDVLWELGGLSYLVIECKNGATTPRIKKHDCNQLNGSAIWFEDKYDSTCTFTPVFIHLATKLEGSASLHQSARIITQEKLDILKSNVYEFIKAVSITSGVSNVERIREKLFFYKLRREDIVSNYTVTFT
ncbi:MAG: DEAD/DEAH box helicase family protein [Pseudomonadales bacterium]